MEGKSIAGYWGYSGGVFFVVIRLGRESKDSTDLLRCLVRWCGVVM